MKNPIRRITPLVVAAAFTLGAFTARAAEEKIDPGPPPSPEETKAVQELAKHGVQADQLAAGLNWRYVNFRSATNPDAALYSQLKSIPSIVELNLAGAQFTPAELANISGL